MKVDKIQYIQFLITFLKDFSPSGRKRVLEDLKKTQGQILCSQNGQRSVSKIGSPIVEQIMKDLEKYVDYVDNEIDWDKTKGQKFDLFENRKAFRFVLKKLQEYSFEGNFFLRDKFLQELGLQKENMFNKLSFLKLKSKVPGKSLVSKQNKHSSNVLGYTDEHVIPIKCQIKKVIEILDKRALDEEIEIFFSKLFLVKLNTDDNEKINKIGLKDKMPNNWNWNQDPFERYWQSGIDPSSLEEF
jgi:hypothetical protein